MPFTLFPLFKLNTPLSLSRPSLKRQSCSTLVKSLESLSSHTRRLDEACSPVLTCVQEFHCPSRLVLCFLTLPVQKSHDDIPKDDFISTIPKFGPDNFHNVLNFSNALANSPRHRPPRKFLVSEEPPQEIRT
ncbi:hypothetical protein CPC08DRAFT_104913 [Agrocybe pediades]|nr:hypothetical protein CPC08DRAFT_104913 [Agrocybe pediades]